jgi:hypothetical protein
LLFTGCGGPHRNAVPIDPLLEALIPPDTTFIAGANIEAIRTTPVFQKYLSQLRLPQMEDFIRKTGLDPRKDLSQILSASNGKAGLFMARGKFGSVKLEGRFNYHGRDLFGDDHHAVMFISSSTAVAGPTPELETLIDDRLKPTHGLPPALRQLVQTIGGERQIWAAFVGGLQGLNVGVPDDSNLGQMIHVFRGIDQGTMGIDLRNGVDFKADLDCHTENDAKHIHDAIRGVIGLGRLSTPDNRPDLLRLYDTVKVVRIQLRVDVTALVAPDLEDKFLDLWLKQVRLR